MLEVTFKGVELMDLLGVAATAAATVDTMLDVAPDDPFTKLVAANVDRVYAKLVAAGIVSPDTRERQRQKRKALLGAAAKAAGARKN